MNSCVHAEGVVDVFSAMEARTLQILGFPEMHDTVHLIPVTKLP